MIEKREKGGKIRKKEDHLLFTFVVQCAALTRGEERRKGKDLQLFLLASM